MLLPLLKELGQGAKILDIGSLHFRMIHQAKKIKPMGLQFYAIDYMQPDELPEDIVFKKVDLNEEPIPFEQDTFDLVLAVHIIEHLKDPLHFFQECLRVLKPGGKIYLETPSERSLLLPGMPFQFDHFYSLSYFDDPTHQSRPWSPQALFRLTKLYGCTPIKAVYQFTWLHRLLFPFVFPLALLLRSGRLLQHIVWNSFGFTATLIAQKPLHLSGSPEFHYYLPKCRV